MGVVAGQQCSSCSSQVMVILLHYMYVVCLWSITEPSQTVMHAG